MSVGSLGIVEFRKACGRSIALTGMQSYRVIVYDHLVNRTVFDMNLSVPCDAAELSADGRFVAVAYWDRANIDVWDLETLRQKSVKSPSQTSRVHFDNTAKWLMYQSERGSYAQSLEGAARTKIQHANDFTGSDHRARDNVRLVPLRRKGQIAVIRFGPSEVVIETVTLPIDSVICRIRISPTDKTLFFIDGKGCVYCYDDELRQLLWRTPVGEHPHAGDYCGDGSLIGLDSSKDVVVLDAKSGERVAKYRGRSCFGTPYEGDTVLQLGCYPGQLLHLRDGSMEVGIAPVFGAQFSPAPAMTPHMEDDNA